MKISYRWLQEYFSQKLPSPEELSSLFTLYAFEVESVETVDDDCVFDIKVLPNRAHDCLSHRGIAREVSVLTGISLLPEFQSPTQEADTLLTVYEHSALRIEAPDPEVCRRCSAVIIRGVSARVSPEWLRKRLEALGQRSVNTIVDATNYSMLAIGQPVHAFDLAHITHKDGIYNISIRESRAGETLQAIGGKEYVLPEGTIVVCDEQRAGNSILDIAGIRGGKETEVNESTKDILILSANFNPVKVRTASKKLGLRTEASVRFENGLTPDYTMEGLQHVSELMLDVSGGSIDALVDVRSGEVSATTSITLAHTHIESVLGFTISKERVESILKSLRCEVKEGPIGKHAEQSHVIYTVRVPHDRLDLTIPHDLIEEIGRVYGFLNVPPLKPNHLTRLSQHDPETILLAYTHTVLLNEGFSEVYTYVFRNDGIVELENPLAQDKKYLRKNLTDGLRESLVLNTRNAPLLSAHDFIKIFEIGTVFDEDGEHVSLGVGVACVKQVRNAQELADAECEKIISTLSHALGIRSPVKIKNGIAEIDMRTVRVEDTTSIRDAMEDWYCAPKNAKYKTISPYPFALRDIAVFVPQGIKADDVQNILVGEAGELLVSASLFDVFTKTFPDGVEKTSYAYKLVFQSGERTLSDDEINVVMEKVSKALNDRNGWQVR